jgi:hypothetical protein
VPFAVRVHGAHQDGPPTRVQQQHSQGGASTRAGGVTYGGWLPGVAAP